MTLGACVVVSKNQVSSELAGEAVILNMDRGMYYGLDEVGARIWKLIQQPQTLSQVRDVLIGEFQVTQDQCERDLLALIEQLSQAGLVLVTDASDQ